MSDNPIAERELPFTYEKLKSWYATLEARTLIPALKAAERQLSELIESEIVEQDRARIKLGVSRIKSPGRLWAKINQPRYLPDIGNLDDIPHVVDDLVGLRIICNNTSDIGTVQQMLLSLPDIEDEPHASISLISSKERNYQQDPKPSGYRAYHINLCVQVGSVRGGWTPASVELQVRTLLQDGWGELTHEDTYKPGTELPPLITSMARRMANLLSCVDEIAQDLRDALDNPNLLRLSAPEQLGSDADRPVVTNEIARTGALAQLWSGGLAQQLLAQFATSKPLLPPTTREIFPEEALIEEARTLVGSLQEPTSLAAIAAQLQSLFGMHIAQLNWGRFGSFKSMLKAAVPDIRIENEPPGWVLPPGFGPEDIPRFSSEEVSASDPEIPEVIRSLRAFEPGLPVIPRNELSRYLNAAAAALDEHLWERLGVARANLGMRDVNLLSKEIRDQLLKAGRPLARRRLSYILLALLNSGNLRPGLPSDELRLIFAAFVESRIGHHGIDLTEQDREALETWFAG
jgi:ppGpp synthetase/RelA/SpoT-type nucleotidyltranferase